jgi:RND family efflux transporter MFP subunit
MNGQKLFYTAVAALAGLLTAAGCSSAPDAANSNTQDQAVTVTTERAVIKPIPTYIEATGSLVGDEETDVAPAVAGKIVQVNFDIGSYVQKGSVLLRLDPRDAAIRLDQARAQLEQQKEAAKQAESGVAQAEANLAQTRARLGVNVGKNYSANDFPAVKAVAAQLKLAQIELERAERLHATGDISQSILDQRRAQRDQLVGQLEDAKANANVAIKAIGTAESAVDAAKAAASGARAAVVTSQTQIDAAQKAVSDTNVYSPISGYVSERDADVGEYISPSAPNTKIATIVRTSTLRVQIDIPESEIGKVATGQGVSIQTAAYPERNFAGTVARISPSLDATARTLTVEAEVQNVDGLLKPGQFATVRITQSKPEQAVMVPAKAVRTVGEVNSVFVVKEGIAREEIVQLGLLEGDMIQIKQGIIEGDMVVTSDLNSLQDGALVNQ